MIDFEFGAIFDGAAAGGAAVLTSDHDLPTHAGRKLFACVARAIEEELGLGDATAITAVEVLWPGSGTRQVFRGLEPDRAYQLRESAESAVALELKRTDFDLKRKLSHRVRDQAGL